MFDWYCGVLQDNADKSQLIYFELIDVIAKPPYSIKQLLTLMTDKDFILKITACKKGMPGMAIQYVVLTKGLHISGRDMWKKYKIQRKNRSKAKTKIKVTNHEEDLLRRYRLFDQDYKAKNIVAVQDILSGKHNFNKLIVYTFSELINAGQEKLSKDLGFTSSAVKYSITEKCVLNVANTVISQVNIPNENDDTIDETSLPDPHLYSVKSKFSTSIITPYLCWMRHVSTL